MDFTESKTHHKSELGKKQVASLHPAVMLVIIFALIDNLDYICTLSTCRAAYREGRLLQQLHLPQQLVCHTRTFGKFNHSSRGRHCEASHRHVDTLVQSPSSIAGSLEKLVTHDLLRMVM